MKLKPIGLVLIIAGVGTTGSILSLCEDSCQRVVKFIPRVFGNVAGARVVPTHIFFDASNNIEVISDFYNNRFLFRDLAKDKNRNAWQSTKITTLKRPHAITYHPASKKYFAVDTSNNQVISFSKLEGSDSDIKRYSELGGYKLGKRPHDIAYNSADGYVYVLISQGVIRFLPNEDEITSVTILKREKLADVIRSKYPDRKLSIGYMRAITIVDGVVYLVNSTQGNVIQIDNFSDPNTWVAHLNKDQPTQYAEAGVFDKDGLILNDVDYYQGYWYATNYYSSKTHNYLSEAAVSKNKVIRWKTWEDFSNSNWQDLSNLVHPESIPYYLSKYDDRFFISMFHIGHKEGEGSGIYEIKTSLF